MIGPIKKELILLITKFDEMISALQLRSKMLDIKFKLMPNSTVQLELYKQLLNSIDNNVELITKDMGERIEKPDSFELVHTRKYFNTKDLYSLEIQLKEKKMTAMRILSEYNTKSKHLDTLISSKLSNSSTHLTNNSRPNPVLSSATKSILKQKHDTEKKSFSTKHVHFKSNRT